MRARELKPRGGVYHRLNFSSRPMRARELKRDPFFGIKVMDWSRPMRARELKLLNRYPVR